MRMGQGVRTGLGHGGITCVLQTQFSSFIFICLLTYCSVDYDERERERERERVNSYLKEILDIAFYLWGRGEL